MQLSEYVNQEMKATGKTSRRAILEPLAVKSGVSLLTLMNIDRGYRLSRYSVAKAIEEATGGAVTVRELCGEASEDLGDLDTYQLKAKLSAALAHKVMLRSVLEEIAVSPRDRRKIEAVLRATR